MTDQTVMRSCYKPDKTLSNARWERTGDAFPRGGGALGYFLGGYVPPETPNWHPVLEKISPKIDTPF